MGTTLAGTLSACNNPPSPAETAMPTETPTPIVSENTIRPSKCGPISIDLQICNQSAPQKETGLVNIFQFRDGDYQEYLRFEDLEINQIYEGHGTLEGLVFTIESDRDLIYRVQEPLLNGTPVPTPLPFPDFLVPGSNA